MSIREAINRVGDLRRVGRVIYCNLDDIDAISMVLDYAEKWADHIDNEDPEGKQDRWCDTCKHECLGSEYLPCIVCKQLGGEQDKWEPKEVGG